jgi:uncharacterized protein
VPPPEYRQTIRPATVGIGLRSAHVAEVIDTRPDIPWLEVHAENYMGGGPAVRALERIRHDCPVSLHSVGVSLGSADGLDTSHLRRLRALVGRLQPDLVSEHVSWSRVGSTFLNHLLPLPYTAESLAVVCRHVEQVQDALGRRILIENPASYLRFHHSTMPEAEFLSETVRRTGCGLLCDVNNLYVTSRNLGFDPTALLSALPPAAIEEFHLAGHSINTAADREILIDDHGAPVAPDVWRLFGVAVARFGPRPTLIEWDTDVPALSVLREEARRAERVIELAVRRSSDAVAP